jgi:hypothetical protein
MLPEVATIYVVPDATAVARPALLIVATLLFEELQVTESVISTWVPSCSVPKALYCTVSPALVESLVGLMVIELRFATVTVTVVEPLMVADVAVALALPGSLAVILPLSDTVKTAALPDDQLTEPVMFLVLPSS